MENNVAIAVRQPLTPDVWQMIGQVAPVIHQSRLFGVASAEQAAAIMLKGFELGLSLTASFEFIQVVQGKPAITPRGALAMILGSPLCAGVKIDDLADANGKPTGCRVWMKRANGFEYTVTWTLADAEKADVIKPDSGWSKYPANMLRWRAVGFCADVVFPDIIGGMKRSDELGADITPEGDVIDGKAAWKAGIESTAAPEKPVTPTITLDELVKKYGAEAVMTAAGGVIPGTDADVATVAKALEQDHA